MREKKAIILVIVLSFSLSSIYAEEKLTKYDYEINGLKYLIQNQAEKIENINQNIDNKMSDFDRGIQLNTLMLSLLAILSGVFGIVGPFILYFSEIKPNKKLISELQTIKNENSQLNKRMEIMNRQLLARLHYSQAQILGTTNISDYIDNMITSLELFFNANEIANAILVIKNIKTTMKSYTLTENQKANLDRVLENQEINRVYNSIEI